MSDARILPRCDVCGVEYVEDYEGPCQEPRGTYTPWVGWSSVCHGTVSYRAAAVKLAQAVASKDQQSPTDGGSA